MGGGARREGKPDFLQHRLQFLHHLVVPEPQHRITLNPQPFITARVISRLFRVLPTIQFDDQSLFDADEIDDVAPERFLPFELQAHEAVGTQVIPEFLLGVGLVAAKLLCIFMQWLYRRRS